MATDELVEPDLVADVLGDPEFQKAVEAAEKKASEIEPPVDGPSDESPLSPQALDIEDQEEQSQDSKETTTEAKDGDEEPSLADAIEEVAAQYGLSVELFKDCESVGEAQRAGERLLKALYRDGQQQAPAMPQPETPQDVPKLPELDLDAFDEDDPVRKNLEALAKRNEALDKRNAALEQFLLQQSKAQSDLEQQRRTQEFQSALTKISPELFGTAEKRTFLQQKKLDDARQAANIIISGMNEHGIRLDSYETLAKDVCSMRFADEVAKTKTLAKRAAVEKRQSQRSVAAPARAANGHFAKPASEAIFDGPMELDPEVLNAVRAVQARYA